MSYYKCKECKKGAYRPYEIGHHSLCVTGIQLEKRAKEARLKKTTDGWGDADYELEPSWYWAESLEGFSRGGRIVPPLRAA